MLYIIKKFFPQVIVCDVNGSKKYSSVTNLSFIILINNFVIIHIIYVKVKPIICINIVHLDKY